MQDLNIHSFVFTNEYFSKVYFDKNDTTIKQHCTRYYENRGLDGIENRIRVYFWNNKASWTQVL